MKENSEELEARIAAYIDGELPPAEAARLEVFLANTDPALAQQIIGMIAEKHAVRSLPKPPAPEDLAGRIMEQIERTSLLNDVEHFSAPRRPWWQSRGAVAAALVLILGGFTFFILEAVFRPDNSWREAMMEGNSHRELAVVQPAASAPAVASVPTGSTTPTAVMPAAPVSIANGSAADGKLDTGVVAPAATGALSTLAAATQPLSSDVVQSAASAPPAGAQPVVLALVARDNQDYFRLRSRLEEFLAADAEPGADKKEMATKEPNQGGFGQVQAPAQAQNNVDRLAQNNSNSNEQYAARAAPGAPVKDDVASQYQEYNAQQRRFNAPAGNGDRSDTEAKAIPYRVLLRPEQLQQLAQEFQVQPTVITRKAIAGTFNGSAFQVEGENSGGSAAAAEEKSAPQHLPVFDQAKETWVDCIITMDPPPSPPETSATPSAPLPASTGTPAMPSVAPPTQPR